MVWVKLDLFNGGLYMDIVNKQKMLYTRNNNFLQDEKRYVPYLHKQN